MLSSEIINDIEKIVTPIDEYNESTIYRFINNPWNLDIEIIKELVVILLSIDIKILVLCLVHLKFENYPILWAHVKENRRPGADVWQKK
jgi:hypothetical protein